MDTVLVGVGGGTGSGKSTLCRALQDKLGKEMMYLIHLDTYFRQDRLTRNRPEAIDIERLYADLERMQNSGNVLPGVNGRPPGSTTAPLVVIEGHLTLAFPKLVERLDLSIYIDMETEERVLRRLERNVRAGSTLDDVVSWYRKDARDNHYLFIEPTKQVADLILWGDITPRRIEVVAGLLRHLVIEKTGGNQKRHSWGQGSF